MSTQHVMATYVPSMIKQWTIFRIEGLELDLHGKPMENLLNGDVMIYHEGSHHNLWVSNANGNHERFVRLFGRQEFSHLVALARGHEMPAGSLDGVQDRLQNAVEAVQVSLRQHNHMPLTA